MNYELLQNTSFSILLGTFGVSLILAIRQGENVHIPFERLALAFLTIHFYLPILSGLHALGDELQILASQLGSKETLDQFVANALYRSATGVDTSNPLGHAANLLNYATQLFRTGIWAVLSSLTELIFALAAIALEVGRDALWDVLLIFFPLGAAFLPLSLRIPINLALMAVELVLWLPVLEVVNIATSRVARRYATNTGDLGFYVLAIEIIAITLTGMIPIITHQIISGTLNATITNPIKPYTSFGKAFLMKKAAAAMGAKIVGGAAKRKNFVFLIAAASLLASAPLHAKETLTLRKGFLKRVECKGRLYASGVGDDSIVEMEVLPSNLGCGVILKPVAAGSTNLILETSTGSIEKNLTIIGAVQKKEVKK